jgi:hypothetical protein
VPAEVARHPASDRLITVGPAGADITGGDNRAIQLAVDAMAQRGGGTVQVLPGEYELIDSIHLRSKVHLVGDRQGTLLRRARVVRSRLAVDADIGERQITPKNASLFHAGMGVMLRGEQHANGPHPPLTVTQVADGVLHTNHYNLTNFPADSRSLVVAYFPMIHGYDVEAAVVDGFTIDAAADDMTDIEDVRIGGVMLTFCRQCTVCNVTVSAALGDGILAEPSQDIVVEHCESFGNTHHGVHFGSHSPGAQTLSCELHDNGSDGLYLCWGVRHGLFRDNRIYRNGFSLHRNGVSLGHKDTDNVIAANHVYENAKHGICFRVKTQANGAHRNELRGNTIENNGRPWSEVPERFHEFERAELLYAGIFINGITHDVVLADNVIRETRHLDHRLQVNAVYLGPGVSGVVMENNLMEGHLQGAVIDESSADQANHRGQTASARKTCD